MINWLNQKCLKSKGDWAPGYLEDMKRSCKSILEEDNNVQIEDPSTGLKTVQLDIIEDLCVNDCSLNGVCNLGWILVDILFLNQNYCLPHVF